MAKKVKRKYNPSDMTGGGLKKAKQILEDKIEYQTLKGIAEEGEGATKTENPGQPIKPEVLNQYTEYLNSLPEEQRGVAMQLIASIHQSSGGNTGMNMGMDPMMMMLMNMMNQGGNNSNDTTAKMIEGQNQVLVELIKNQGNNKGGDSVADIMKAVNEAKGNQDEILTMLLQGLIDSSGKDDVDEKLSFLTKAKEAGLITDPHTLFEVKKLESESERERYKIDKDYDIRKLEIDKDKEQTDKASEFLSEIASTVQNLNNEEEKGEKRTENNVSQPAELTYPCPSCETPVTISPQTEDGSKVKCPGCDGSIRVKRKPQKQEA